MMRVVLLTCVLLLAIYSSGQEVQKDSSLIILKEVEIKGYRIDPDISFKNSRILSDSNQNSNYGNVAELIRYKTGIFVKSYGSSGVSSLSLRGTGAAHTNLYWNGINVSSPTLGQADFSLLPVTAVDEINIRHGLSSLVDGSGGLGGSVSISNQMTDDPLNILLDLRAGSFGQFGSKAHIAWSEERLSAKTSIYFNEAANNFSYQDISREGHPITTMEHAYFKSRGFVQEMYYKVNRQNTLSLMGMLQDTYRELPNPIIIKTPSTENLSDFMANVSALWELIKENSALRLNVGTSHSRSQYANENDKLLTNYLINSIQADVRYKKLFPAKNVSIEIGGRNEYYTAQNSYYSNDINENRLSLMAMMTKKANRFGFSVLLRQESIDSQFSPLLGSLGISFKLPENGIVKFNLARNYRYPTMNDRYWIPGGNEDLLPERSYTIELGYAYKQDINANFGFETELTVFNNAINDWIMWVPTGSFWSPQNVKKVHNWGIEFMASSKLQISKLSMKLNASYAYTVSENREFTVPNAESVGKQLIYVPFHKFNIDVGVMYSNWTLSYVQYYTGDYFITSDNMLFMPAYAVADISLSYDLLIRNASKNMISLGASIRNLFDWQYQIMPYRPEPGRHFVFNLRYKLSQ